MSAAGVTPRRDYRDVVIEALAESEAALRAGLADALERAEAAECAAEVYRLIAMVAMPHIAGLRTELDRVTERYYRNLDDARDLRGRLIAADEQKAAA